MAPATRERTSTRPTASRRPEYSRESVTERGSTVATATGMACGAPIATVVSALAPSSERVSTAAPAIETKITTPAPHRSRRTTVFFINALLETLRPDKIEWSVGHASSSLEESGEMAADDFPPLRLDARTVAVG